jgi:hypothetical protein
MAAAYDEGHPVEGGAVMVDVIPPSAAGLQDQAEAGTMPTSGGNDPTPAVPPPELDEGSHAPSDPDMASSMGSALALRAEGLSPPDQEGNTAPLASPKVRVLTVKDIQVGNRARSLDPERVKALAKSVKELGLRTPITVRIAPTIIEGEEQAVPFLVAGLHRLEAVKRLRRGKIRCFIEAGSELVAQLWEIDENLCRADLSELEEGEHLLRRKQIYEQLHPETRSGGRPGKAGGGKKPKAAKRTIPSSRHSRFPVSW